MGGQHRPSIRQLQFVVGDPGGCITSTLALGILPVFAYGGYDGALEVGPLVVLPKPDPSHRYRRPYEGTDVGTHAMQAYLDWEYGLVEQLRRDATHGFSVI